MSARVYFIQQIQNKELPLYFSLADCLCNPSSTEAMSSALIEAMACGTPVITSTVAALGVDIKDGEDGIVIPEYNDPAKIANVIREVCKNPGLKDRISSEALKKAKEYDKSKIDRKEVDYYRKILRMKEMGRFKRNIFFKIHMVIRRSIYRALKRIKAIRINVDG